MNVTGFNSGTGVATVARAQNGTTAAAHSASVALSSGALSTTMDNVMITGTTHVIYTSNHSLEDWTIATFPPTNIHNDGNTPTNKSRVNKAVEFANNLRFRVFNNINFILSGGANTQIQFNTGNSDEYRDDYKGTVVPTETYYRTSQQYMKTDTSELYVYDGTAWDLISGAGGVGTVGPTGAAGPKGDTGLTGANGGNTSVLSQVTVLPTAGSTNRGSCYLLLGASGVADTEWRCIKLANGVFDYEQR